MTLSGKASFSVILSGLRAIDIGSSTTIKTSMNYVFRQRLSQSRNMSSFEHADKDLVDVTLAKVLKNRINSAKSNLKISQIKMPATDTFPFEIKKEDFSSFERKFPDGEVVTVRAFKLRFYEDKCEDDEVMDEISNDMNTPPAIPMYVKVIRNIPREDSLDFEITVSEEDIIIHNYSYLTAYGVKIQELDSQLQRYLSKYLEERGIKSIASFLINNKCSEKAKQIHLLSFMEQLKKIIQK